MSALTKNPMILNRALYVKFKHRCDLSAVWDLHRTDGLGKEKGACSEGGTQVSETISR